MLTNLLIGLAVAIAALVVLIASRPGEFRITRSARMHAPPSTVFSHVNDFHLWDAWSPWAKLDPDCHNEFFGPSSGQGASFAWDGNSKIGAGRMEIVDSRPCDLIRIRLEFLRPFKAVNTAEFTFQPEGDQTLVAWSMYGKSNFISKAMSLVMDCDKMVGPQFEKGMASLQRIAESDVAVMS